MFVILNLGNIIGVITSRRSSSRQVFYKILFDKTANMAQETAKITLKDDKN